MKIVLTDSYTMNPGDLDWEQFDLLGDVVRYEYSSQEELLDRVRFADIIVANKTVLSKELLTVCKSLKLICVSATGFNNVDTMAAKELGIPICNAADYSSTSVAQHVFASILQVYNNISFYSQSVHDGRWQKSRDFTYYDKPIDELNGKTLGILGYGNIGQAVASVGRAFGMNIVVMAHPSKKLVIDDAEVLEKSDFLANADIVSLHIPLRPETAGLVDREFLAEMKDSAILVNTARGPIVSEIDLANALKSGEILAACIDVLPQEPPSESPLFGIASCIITPHQAWASKQARERLMKIVIDNIRSFQGGVVSNRVG